MTTMSSLSGPDSRGRRPIRTASEAARVAEQLVEKYYPFRQLRTAKPEDGTWIVEFDVGAIRTIIVRIKLNSLTGAILEVTSGEQA